MTIPRDALRALVSKWRVDAERDSHTISPALLCSAKRAKSDADELAAILSQMDSEPTVAQWREAIQWDAWHPRAGDSYEWLERIEQRARFLAAKDKQL